MDQALTALLVLAWAWPSCLALLWIPARLRLLGQRLVPFAALPALLLAVLAFPLDVTGLTVRMPLVFSGLHLALDATGRAFLVLTALLWVLGGVFARAYHRRDPARSALYLFFTLTMAGNVGLVLAADGLTFYLFFALMSFSAYGLVVHRGDGEARRAGRVYIVLAVLGELALLAGLLALGAVAGVAPRFGEQLEATWVALAAPDTTRVGAGAAGLLLIAGFAVKAGLAPLHVWLPLAHPVAPTPASALLSGAMIKAGLLGWLRFLPVETALPELAAALLCAGLFSAFYGVLIGLAQDRPKTILAYSSVSQMGYMAVAMAALLWTGAPPAIGLAGVLLYAVHHGLAKAALFLSVGVGEGAAGSARARRWCLGLAALPALALSGLPATGGALAKSALKGGLGELGSGSPRLVALLFFLGSVGTTLLMARFLVALARRAPRAASDGPALAPLLAPWLLLVGVGAGGVLWLPHLIPPLESGEPWRGAWHEGWLAAALPVCVGLLLAWAALRGSRVVRLRAAPSVPAGDLLVPIERLIARLPRIDSQAWSARTRSLARRVPSGRATLEHLLRRFAREDLRAMWGPILGASLLAIAAALALALA